MYATWTPNESDGASGPLPLSQQKRQQLLQLEDAIRTSPDPQGTLHAAAASIHMDPQDLLSMLERNHADMQQTASTPRATRRLVHGVGTLTMALTHWTRRHVRQATLLLTLLVVSLYVLQTAPTSGTVISSSRRPLLSNGPTTLFRPPILFVQTQMLHSDTHTTISPVLANWKRQEWMRAMDQLQVQEDGSIWHKSTSNLSQAASAQVTLDLTALTHDADEDDELQALVEELAWEQAAFVLKSKLLTERVADPNAVQLVVPTSSNNDKNAVLVVKGLGDYKRYGMVGLRVAEQRVNDTLQDELCLSMNTWANSHFDGRLHVSVTKQANNELTIRVYLMIPKHGNRIARNTALSIVHHMASSIADSIRIRTQQTLARRHQSNSFSKSAKTRAQTRRKTRHDMEQQMETMSTERRRKWHRSNPNVGHYRPSNDRLKSPLNAMY
ncbi:hypothetical protein MPSEU_000178000 [Mayamaea pseudoterrestris]|nr:hypothetical protein MPSEU_000178000 [Mayamaea pseudoterrestris]